MEKEFLSINNSIIDYYEYQRETVLLKNYLKIRFKEILLKEGFKLETCKSKKYDSMRLAFYEQEKDFEVKIIVRKRSKEEFV